MGPGVGIATALGYKPAGMYLIHIGGCTLTQLMHT